MVSKQRLRPASAIHGYRLRWGREKERERERERQERQHREKQEAAPSPCIPDTHTQVRPAFISHNTNATNNEILTQTKTSSQFSTNFKGFL